MSWSINSEDLKKELDQPGNGLVLLDVREQDEFDEFHLKNCVLIPLGELSERAPKELNPKDNIVVYCAHGMRSMQGLMALKQLGFEKVRSLEGGICEWEERFDVVRGA